MAHFAELSDGKVSRVVVLSNDVAPDEATGIAFLRDLLGADTEWAQTSYNNSQIEGAARGKYAGIGDEWDGTAFSEPTP